VLSTLVDRRFLAEAGRKDVAGRPILYKTTADFLEAFGLRSLEELPPIDVDAAAPIELAFQIPTQAVQPAAEANTATEPASAIGAGGEDHANAEPVGDPTERAAREPAAVDESENVFLS